MEIVTNYKSNYSNIIERKGIDYEKINNTYISNRDVTSNWCTTGYGRRGRTSII